MLLNNALAMAILGVISHVYLASFVIILSNSLNIPRSPVFFYLSQFVLGIVDLRFSLLYFFQILFESVALASCSQFINHAQ